MNDLKALLSQLKNISSQFKYCKKANIHNELLSISEKMLVIKQHQEETAICMFLEKLSSIIKENVEKSIITASKYDKILSTMVLKEDASPSEIIGYNTIRNQLKEAIFLPNIAESYYNLKYIKINTIMLYGPPGTGKTKLAMSLLKYNITFYNVKSSCIISKWYGESEKIIERLFDVALNDNSIIFFDEIDSMCRKRDHSDDDHNRRLKNQMLLQIDKCLNKMGDKILFICATNYPWDLDDAFLRRMNKKIYVALPNLEERKIMLKDRTHKILGINIPSNFEDNWHDLAVKMEGLTGSDIENIITEAVMTPLRELNECKEWKMHDDGFHVVPCIDNENISKFQVDILKTHPERIKLRKISIDDFTNVMTKYRPTVNDEMLKNYERFMLNLN